MQYKKITPKLLNEFRKILSVKQISNAESDLAAHAKDRSFHNAAKPDIVIWPENTKEVSAVLTLANKYAIPVTAWGGGSSTEGNPIPVAGGIVLDMTRMDKILNVFPKDLQVSVQPGIIGDELNRQLEKYNLFFPPAPGSSYMATVGGMIANNAGGMHAVQYGVVGDWVLQLEIVLANGDIITTGSRSFKSVSGYDLKRLFIGSEGTLGIITQAVFKLTPVPQSKIAVLIAFKNFEKTALAAQAILTSNIQAAAIEYMDDVYIKYINQAKNLSFPEKPTLIVQFHGDKQIIMEEMEKIKKLCKKNGSLFEQNFTTPEKLKTLWEYRRAGRTVLSKVYPTKGILAAEVGMPISQVGKFLTKTKEVSKKYGLQTIMFGHIGDGNFHCWALYEQNDAKSWGKVTKLNEELVTFALSLGGTITGEHGIGIGKRKFMSLEHPTTLPIMKEIKLLLDPKGILNPGKMFPEN